LTKGESKRPRSLAWGLRGVGVGPSGFCGFQGEKKKKKRKKEKEKKKGVLRTNNYIRASITSE
jgi:hypothetical protein